MHYRLFGWEMMSDMRCCHVSPDPAQYNSNPMFLKPFPKHGNMATSQHTMSCARD